jgi:hypothetical protein
LLIALVALWIIAHLLQLGPIRDAVDVALVWTVGLAAASAAAGALTVLVVGLLLGGSRPAWLRFIQGARTVAAVGGCGLILVGLVRYQDTEPPDIRWIVAGLVVLAAAAVVHAWVTVAARRTLT